MKLSKQLTARVELLQRHFQAFYVELEKKVECEIEIHQEEVFAQWVILKLASLELSIENVIAAVHKGTELQLKASREIKSLKGN